MKSISRADPKYALDSGHQAVASVGLGESFVVETHDCRTGTITRADQARDLLDTRCVNPATGPISVAGVKAGDTICVEIEQLHVDSRLGLMVTRPGVTGLDIAGRVQARVTVVAGWSLPTPIVQTDELVAVIADGATFDEAAKSAMAKAVEVLTAGGMDPVDAGFLMSAAGHLRVCQYIPNASLVHCRFELPKSILALNQISIPNLQSAR